MRRRCRGRSCWRLVPWRRRRTGGFRPEALASAACFAAPSSPSLASRKYDGHPRPALSLRGSGEAVGACTTAGCRGVAQVEGWKEPRAAKRLATAAAAVSPGGTTFRRYFRSPPPPGLRPGTQGCVKEVASHTSARSAALLPDCSRAAPGSAFGLLSGCSRAASALLQGLLSGCSRAWRPGPARLILGGSLCLSI